MTLTWTSRTPPNTFTFGSLAIDPINGITVIRDSSNNHYRSTDGGATWASINTLSVGATGSLAFGGSRFLTSDGGGFHYSTDGGVTWTTAATPPSNFVGNLASRMMFTSSLGTGQGMWVAVQAAQFATSTDGGNTWTAGTTISSILGTSYADTPNIIWDGTQFAFPTRDAANANSVICYSTDGSTWSTLTIASIFTVDEVRTLTYSSGTYTVGMTGAAHVRQSSTFAGLATASDTDLSSLLPGCSYIGAAYSPDGVVCVAAGQVNSTTNDAGLAEQDAAGGSWSASTSPLPTSNFINAIGYDAFHAALIAVGGGTTSQILTASYADVPILLTPSTATVPVNGGSQQFTGHAADGSQLDWFVNGIFGGSAAVGYITQGGLYTAPIGVNSVPAPVTITAALDRAPSVFATATVTLTIPASPVVITGKTATPGPSGIKGAPGTSGVYGTAGSPSRFVVAGVFPPVMTVNAKGIFPKIYMPPENTTVKA